MFFIKNMLVSVTSLLKSMYLSVFQAQSSNLSFEWSVNNTVVAITFAQSLELDYLNVSNVLSVSIQAGSAVVFSVQALEIVDQTLRYSNIPTLLVTYRERMIPSVNLVIQSGLLSPDRELNFLARITHPYSCIPELNTTILSELNLSFQWTLTYIVDMVTTTEYLIDSSELRLPAGYLSPSTYYQIQFTLGGLDVLYPNVSQISVLRTFQTSDVDLIAHISTGSQLTIAAAGL